MGNVLTSQKSIRDDFKIYEYALIDGSVLSIQAENIYEALEVIVRIEGIHPTQITSINEK